MTDDELQLLMWHRIANAANKGVFTRVGFRWELQNMID